MRYSLKVLPAAISEAYGIKYRLTALNDDGSESWRLSVKTFEELQGFVPGEVYDVLREEIDHDEDLTYTGSISLYP